MLTIRLYTCSLGNLLNNKILSVNNKDVEFGKDSGYEFLKCFKYNWRKLILALIGTLYGFFNRPTGDDRQSVLIMQALSSIQKEGYKIFSHRRQFA
jgi:hypothetical protein